MGIMLEKPQQDAVEMIEKWFNKTSRDPFVIAGLAGTGKTTIVKYFIDKLAIHPDDVAFVAFTGKAALVLTNMGTPATTIHKLIYKVVEDKEGNITFEKADKLPTNLQLIVVDEASMVSEDVQWDLESFHVPIIYLGDHGQLPPVQGVSKLMLNPDVKLEKIHRQAEGNPIIWLAKMARLGAKIPFKTYAPGVVKIHMKDVTPNILLDVEQILCGKNATRVKLNERVRSCLGRKTASVAVNDKVICLRNNWQKGYVNGMVGTVANLKKFDKKDVPEKDFWRVPEDQMAMDFRPDYNEDEMLFNIPYDAGVFTKAVPPDMKNKIIEPFDYAYAITVHKSQGSQYNTGLVIEEYLGDAAFHKKWLYTAVTRFAAGLVLVGK